LKISIITVCYNSEATIEKTIQSVLEQTFNNIEYIVVDGNSKDNTLQIIKKYESNLNQWISEPDNGLYDAMNKGIELATGDIVGILNSDDTFYNNNVLKKLANFHKQNQIDASIGNIIQHNKNGKIVRNYSSKNWQPNKLKIGFMPPHPSIFFKRVLFKKLGNYQLDYTIGADYELVTRFFLNNKINWKYSGITTTSMLIGGLSSSGYKSYRLISKEIMKALIRNRIAFSPLKVRFRGFFKIMELFKKQKTIK